MEDKIKQQNIQRLDISDNSINLLNQNKIKTIGQLCKKTKKELRNIGMTQNEINKAEIELELLALSLKNSL